MRNSISHILFVATIVSFQQLPRSCITGQCHRYGFNHNFKLCFLLPLKLIILLIAIDVTANFIETPSPMAIEVMEMDAVFRCRHQRIEADISWLMNGTSSGFYLEILVWGGRGHGTFTHSPLLQTIKYQLDTVQEVSV